MIELPPTLLFAVRKVKDRTPSATPSEVCQELVRLGWTFDESAVVAHLEGVRERVLSRRSASPEPDLWRGIDLEALPVELSSAVRKELVAHAEPPRPAVSGERRSGPRWDEALDGMRRALRAEIAATRERFAESRFSMQGGMVLGSTERGFTVRYEVAADPPVSDGSQVLVETGPRTELHAEVLQLAGTSLTLWVAGSAQPPPQAVLVIDASFLLGLRLKFLDKLANGSPHFDSVSGMKILTGQSDEPDAVVAVWDSQGALSTEQETAVSRALAGGVTWLWGPPGTGKTTTLAHMLSALADRRRRILFVSNTNAAVDTALLKFLDVDDGSTRPIGAVLRIGEPVTEELRNREGTPVTASRVADQLGIPAGRHLVECNRRIGKLRSRRSQLSMILDAPMRAAQRGLIGNPDSDQFELLQLIDQHGFEAEHEETLKELGVLAERRKALEGLLEELRRFTLSRAQVVFATVHQTYLRGLEEQRFDVVVIDEASMVSADLAVIAAGLGAGHTVIAGDFRQLGPIALAQSSEAQQWLLSSAFERSGIARSVTTGIAPSNLVALRVQHRMRSNIERVIADGFYPELGLRGGEGVHARVDRLPFEDFGQLVLIDTAALRPWLACRNGRYSRYNPIHAQVVDALVQRAPEGPSLGVVAPFAPQASLYRALVEDPALLRAAATVHRFQGGERDVMIWDMTEGRAGNTAINRWFQADNPDQEGTRLMNVALSRARNQLFVVADLDRAKVLPEHTVLRKTLRVIEREGQVADARDVLERSPRQTCLNLGGGPSAPLRELLKHEQRWVSIWSSAPPGNLEDGVSRLLRTAVRRGVGVYVRTGVPSRPAEWGALEELHRAGCSVQLVRPCWENVAFSASTVITSPGGLFTLGPTQPWVVTENAAFAGSLARLIRRAGDIDFDVGAHDETCPRGHPLLVEVGHERDFRGRCLVCQGDVTAKVRTGRSRASAAAVRTPTCGSCGRPYGIDGRCGC